MQTTSMVKMMSMINKILLMQNASLMQNIYHLKDSEVREAECKLLQKRSELMSFT